MSGVWEYLKIPVLENRIQVRLMSLSLAACYCL